jgi:glycosyltransferase involved in cell wall biosynthesis
MTMQDVNLVAPTRVRGERKLRVTFLMPCDDLSGGNRVVATYAKQLMDRGYQVLVINDAKHKPTLMDLLRMLRRGDFAAWMKSRGLRPGHIEMSGVPHYELKQRGVLTYDELPDADILIATWWLTAEWIAKAPASKGAKVYFIQGYEVFDYVPIERVKATWRLPFHKITISNWLVDIAAKEYGDYDVSLVPNSVNLEQFQSAPRGKQSRPTVGLVYSVIPMKGLALALEAIRLAQIEVPDLQVHVFGADEVSSQYPLPEGSQYFKAPSQSKIRDIYASCDAWLFSSRGEGFGLPIIESMACRTPVIGFPSGAAPEFLADNRGILVKPEDPVDMAKAIVTICKMSDSQWRAMSESAYQKIKNYQAEEAADLFEQALLQAVVKAR